MDFATPKRGRLGNNPGVGVFKNGRCDFYDYEPITGKSRLVQLSIWAITLDTAQSFSEDAGKTGEVNWVNGYTRVKGERDTELRFGDLRPSSRCKSRHHALLSRSQRV